MDTKISSLSKIIKTIQKIYSSLSPERVIVFWLLFIISILFIFSGVVIFNKRFLIQVPTYGGNISEGIIGTPRFINPVLANNEQDKDLTALVYAGLTKKDNANNITLDMAESITESDDGLTYTATLKPRIYFHDMTPVNVDDIIYTVAMVQNPNIKSPEYIKWEGVTVQKQDDRTIIFTLKKPYPLFMGTLSLGILPKYIWKNLTEEQFSLSDYNIHAIGSGPYAIKKIQTVSGIPTTFTLVSHSEYSLGRPFVNTVTIHTYPSEKSLLQAFTDNEINRIHGIAADTIGNLSISTSSIHTSLLPRTFSVFFNQNKSLPLADKQVRTALNLAINKEAILDSVLHNYGKVISAPYPFDDGISSSTYNKQKAVELLNTSKAFRQASSTFQINLTTANTDEMKKIAQMIQSDWEAIGIKTTLAVYEVSDLNQSVIKDRDFQTLLFGSIVESPSDLYAFWHSSQRNYPGLNISNYASTELDKNLEVLRNEPNERIREDAYNKVKKEFEEETPGIFLFTPSLIYATKDKVETVMPTYSTDNSSRFTLITKWHRYTEMVWPKMYSLQVTQLLENILH